MIQKIEDEVGRILLTNGKNGNIIKQEVEKYIKSIPEISEYKVIYDDTNNPPELDLNIVVINTYIKLKGEIKTINIQTSIRRDRRAEEIAKLKDLRKKKLEQLYGPQENR